jgi:7-carboxy-7-deazaguanine synthase
MNIPQVYVSEVFESIQGEGVLAGYRTLFIRLQGCHVGCTWCDTKYSWKQSQKHAWKAVDFLQHITKLVDGRDVWLCFTGGEPLEQFESLQWLIEKLFRNGIEKLSIETSGMPMPDRKHIIDITLCDVFHSISPKLPSAIGRRFSDAMLMKVVQFWHEAVSVPFKLQFKFVISTTEDLSAVSRLLAQIPVMQHPVILQIEHARIRTPKLIEQCVAFTLNHPDVRLSAQLHRVLQLQ